jgi:hypothetical protein
MAKNTDAAKGSGSDGRETWSRQTDQHATDFKRAKSPAGYRVGAIILWLLGIAIETFATLYVAGDASFGSADVPWGVVVAVAVVLDVVLVLLGASLWKKAGEARAKAKGTAVSGDTGAVRVVLSTLAFVPMVLFFAVSKNASTKTRLLSVISALVAVGCLAALVVAL